MYCHRTAATHNRNTYTILDRWTDISHSHQEYLYNFGQKNWQHPLISATCIPFLTEELTAATHISNMYTILDRRTDSSHSNQQHVYHSWQMNWQQPLTSGILIQFWTEELTAPTHISNMYTILDRRTDSSHSHQQHVYHSWQKWQHPLTTGILIPFLTDELTAATHIRNTYTILDRRTDSTHSHQQHVYHSWQKNWQQPLTSATCIPFLTEELTAATHISNKYTILDRRTDSSHSHQQQVYHSWQKNWQQPLTSATCIPFLTDELTSATHIRNTYTTLDRRTDSTHSHQQQVYHSWQKNWQQPLTSATCIPFLTDELTSATHIRNTYTTLDRRTDSTHSYQQHVYHSWQKNWQQPLTSATCIPFLTEELTAATQISNMYTILDRWTDSSHSHQEYLYNFGQKNWQHPLTSATCIPFLTEELTAATHISNMYTILDRNDSTHSQQEYLYHSWQMNWQQPLTSGILIQFWTEELTAPTHISNMYTILDRRTDSSHSHQQHVYHSWQMNWQQPLTSATCIPFLTEELTAATHISNMYTILDRWTDSSHSHQQHVYHSWQMNWQQPLTSATCIPFLTDELTAPTHISNMYTILDRWTDSSHSHQQHVYHSWQMNWQQPLTSATCIPFLTEMTAPTHNRNTYTILDRWTDSSHSHQEHVYHSWQKWQHPLTTGILIPFLTDELTAATHIRNMYTTLDRRSDSTHSQQEHFYHSWQMTWHQPLTSGILIQFWTDELTVAAHISNKYSILDRNDSTYSQQEHLYHSW